MDIKPENKLDLLDIKAPALSSTSDMPVIETKPDAHNEGAPPKKIEGEAPAAPEKAEPNGESATPPAESTAADDEPEQKKPAKGVQKRLDELTRQREEAKREAEAEKQEKLRLLALLEQRNKPEETKPAPVVSGEAEPVKPSKADFSDPDAYDAAIEQYVVARAEWVANAKVTAALEKQKKDAEQKDIERGQQAARDAYAARVEKAKAKYSDYQAKAESPDVQVSPVMAQAILNTEHGPDIAYHLGNNPAEAARISALNPVQQLVELGLIVAKTSQPAAPAAAAPAAEVKPPLTQAPKPIKPLGAGEGGGSKSPDDMSMDEYAAMRKPQLQRRPGTRT